MPICSLRPVFVEEGFTGTGEVVQHIYIVHEKIEPDLERMHDWMKKNFPDHEMLSIGKHYVMRNTEDFEIAFKLTWS